MAGWGDIAASFNAGRNARMQRDAMDMQMRREQMAIDKEAATQKALSEYVGGNTQALKQANPSLWQELEQRNMANQMHTAQLGEIKEKQHIDKAKRTANYQNFVAQTIQSKPESVPQVLAMARQKMQAGEIEPFALPGDEVTPEAIGQLQLEAQQGQALYDPQKPAEEKTTTDLINFRKVSPFKDEDPRFGPAFDKWMINQNHTKASQTIIGGQQKLSEGMVRGLQEKIEAGEGTLSKIEYIKSLGDPTEYLTLRAKFGTGGKTLRDFMGLPESVPLIGGLSDTEKEQLSRATDFEQATADVMLEARRAVTGTGGGEKEMEKIESSMLSGKLSPAQYSAAIKRVEENIRLANSIKSDMLNKGINVDNPKYYDELRRRWNQARGDGGGAGTKQQQAVTLPGGEVLELQPNGNYRRVK